MAEKPNGAGAPIGYMLPGATNEYALPPAPGEPAHGWENPPVANPMEHVNHAPSSSVPDVESYVGGGIFAAETIGPADLPLDSDSLYSPPSSGAMDFAPSAQVPLQAPMSGHPMMAPMAQVPLMMPMGQMKNEQAHLLGASVIAVAAGTVAGAKYGGLYGAIAGSLVGGALVNAYRAFSYYKEGTPDSDKEAKISGTYAVLSTAAAAALWIKLVPEQYKANMSLGSDDDDDDDDDDDPWFSDRMKWDAELTRLEEKGLGLKDREFRNAQEKYSEAVRKTTEASAAAKAARKRRRRKKALANPDSCNIRPVGP